MEKFGWKQEYSIGDEKIDSEHKWLLSLANEVLGFSRNDEEVDKVKAAVMSLYNYAKTHFENEEAFMRQIDYKGLADHQKLHKVIVNEMNKIMRKSKTIDVLVYKFKRLMNDWVLQHIIVDDKKIIQAKNTSPS